MSLRFLRNASALLSAATVLSHATPSFAASWQTNVNYGASTKMDLYVPDAPAPSPPIVVALHYCSGMATNARGWLQSYADQHGFAIITPQAGGNCFDAAASRSGERANIAAMVAYVVMEHGADPTRVFAVGASSGACMTQALLAAYPEVFAAGSSLAGVPAGAWTSGNNYGWSTSGTSGGQAWGDKVRQASPSFTGTRPRIQLWHGQGDTTLTYSQSYPQQVEQWTNVFGVTAADGTMEMIKPMGAQDTWARTSYKDDTGVVVVEANSGPSNVPHDLSGRGLWGDVVRFFALDKPATGSGGMGGMGGMGSGGQATGGAAAGTGPATGGMGGSTAMGGSSGTGPASGGAGTGGTAMTGGAGGMGSGGTAPAAGGMASATGGTMSTGGTSSGAGTGGAGATGGTTMTGAGGMSAPSAGRSGTATGGAGGTGATGATSGGGDDTTDTESGCSIRVGAAPLGVADGAVALVGLGALGVLLRRRRG
jgi:poly(hydroxyalkanoate) depolymerase family esterase